MNAMILRFPPAALLIVGLSPVVQAGPGSTALPTSLALTTDYRFRGISQTRQRPALQGGAELVHGASGLYLGNWFSTIRWVGDAGGASSLELDVNAGKRGQAGRFSYDAGVLAYLYPSSRLVAGPNTREAYLQAGYGPAWIKYSHAVSTLFGIPGSRHSGYLDLGATVDLAAPGLVLNLHAGRQHVRGHGSLSYNDYRIGITRTRGPAALSLALVGTNTQAYTGPDGRNLGKTGLVLTATTTF